MVRTPAHCAFPVVRAETKHRRAVAAQWRSMRWRTYCEKSRIPPRAKQYLKRFIDPRAITREQDLGLFPTCCWFQGPACFRNRRFLRNLDIPRATWLAGDPAITATGA